MADSPLRSRFLRDETFWGTTALAAVGGDAKVNSNVLTPIDTTTMVTAGDFGNHGRAIQELVSRARRDYIDLTEFVSDAVADSGDYKSALDSALDKAATNGKGVTLPAGQFFVVQTAAAPRSRLKGHTIVKGAGVRQTHLVVSRASSSSNPDFFATAFEQDFGYDGGLEDLRVSGASVPPWAAGKTLGIGQRRTTTAAGVTRSYEVITPGVTSAQPTGTSQDITDGTVHWRYLCDNPLPLAPSMTPWTAGMTAVLGQWVTHETGDTASVFTGTSTSVGTSGGLAFLTQTGAGLTVNAHSGRFLKDSAGAQFVIISNTATTFTLGGTVAPTAGAYAVYAVGDRTYKCITPGTAGSTGPTTTSADITDGSIHWQYMGDGDGSFIETQLGVQDACAFYVPPTPNDLTPYKPTLRRVRIDGFVKGVLAPSGSAGAVNDLELLIDECDIWSFQVKVAFFSDTAATPKRLIVRRSLLHSTGMTSTGIPGTSHGIYCAPNASLEVDRVTFRNIATSEYAIQHYGSSSAVPKFVRITNDIFEATVNNPLISTPNGVTQFHGNTVLSTSGLDLRGPVNATGNLFQGSLLGSYDAITTSTGLNHDAMFNVTGNFFDFRNLAAANCSAVSLPATKRSIWNVGSNQYYCPSITSGSITLVRVPTGAEIPDVLLSDDQVFSPAAATNGPVYLQANNGRITLRGLKAHGGYNANVGLLNFTGTSTLEYADLDGITLNNTRVSTASEVIVADANSAGKVWGGTNNRLNGDEVQVNGLGWLQLNFRRRANMTPITPTVHTPATWTGNTAYRLGALVKADTTGTPTKVYMCITPGTSAASGGPSGTDADITDGGAHWRYLATSGGTTIKVLNLDPDYDTWYASGDFDYVAVNMRATVAGKSTEAQGFIGARGKIFSTDGTLNASGFGNIASTGAVAANASIRFEIKDAATFLRDA